MKAGLVRVLVSALVLVSTSPGNAARLTEAWTGSRLETHHAVLEYERPWAELPVDVGSVDLGVPLGGKFWVGVTAGQTRAPTVKDVSLGAWCGRADWFKVRASRRRVGVDTLPARSLYDASVDLRLGAGVVACGWSVSVRGMGEPVAPPALRQEWWLRTAGDGYSVMVGRRSDPWAARARWAFGVEFGLGPRTGLAILWRNSESVLALRTRLPGTDVTAATAWSGPRAGGFGLRAVVGP
jgi:hypothetical protein